MEGAGLRSPKGGWKGTRERERGGELETRAEGVMKDPLGKRGFAGGKKALGVLN